MSDQATVDFPKAGERIRIHPAYDWFMRGETHAVVCFARKHSAGPSYSRLRVQGERSGKRFWLSVDNVLEVVG